MLRTLGRRETGQGAHFLLNVFFPDRSNLHSEDICLNL